MTYHRGILTEFNTWHDAAKLAEGIPVEGKINSAAGILMPNNQRTTACSNAISHPSNIDDYIWDYWKYIDLGEDSFSLTEVQAAGFLPDPEE